MTLRDERGEVIVGDTTGDGVVPPGPASALARGGDYDFTEFFECEKEDAPRCLTRGQSFRIQGVPQAVGPRSTATTEQLCGSTLSGARRGIESLIFVRGAPSAAPYLSISGGYDWLAREERAGGAASALDLGPLSESPARPPLSSFVLSSSFRSLSSGRALHGNLLVGVPDPPSAQVHGRRGAVTSRRGFRPRRWASESEPSGAERSSERAFFRERTGDKKQPA